MAFTSFADFLLQSLKNLQQQQANVVPMNLPLPKQGDTLKFMANLTPQTTTPTGKSKDLSALYRSMALSVISVLPLLQGSKTYMPPVNVGYKYPAGIQSPYPQRQPLGFRSLLRGGG